MGKRNRQIKCIDKATVETMVQAAGAIDPHEFDSGHVVQLFDSEESLGDSVAHLRQNMVDLRLQRRLWTRRQGDDHPEVRDWTWPL